MKKHIFLFIALTTCFVSYLSAQNVSIGMRGGLTIPNLRSGSGAEVNPLNEGYSSREGLGIGVFAEFKICNLFSIQPMLEYSQQGGKKNGFQAFPIPEELAQSPQAPPYLYADYKSEAKLNYLMLPVLAKFGWNLGHQSPWSVYADVGPYAGLLLNAHQVVSGGVAEAYYDAQKTQPVIVDQESGQALMINFDSTENIKNQLHSFNFGIEGNVGIQYKFARNAVFIEGGGNYGLLNIQKGTANGKNHSGAATVMLGYKYDL